MMKFLFLSLLLCAYQANNTAHDKALASLVEAERGFAAASVAKGFHQAFVENLAEDAIVFAPQPTNGKKLHASAPESKARLTWYPAYADISGSLNWGYTTGPYEYRATPEDEAPAGAGFYLTVWKRQPDGKWKAAIDMGNSYPVEQIKQEAYKPSAAAKAGGVKGTEKELLRQDTATAQAYYPETLLYRQGQYPYRYSAATTEPAADIIYTTLGHDISPASDMAYTYGSYSRPTSQKTETGYYLKVWKVVDGQWKLAAHNLAPSRE